MGIKEFFQNMAGGVEDDGLPDDVTRDKYLRSLRRQRRLQMEEQEKIRLKKSIAAYNKKKTRKELWGISDKPKPKNVKQRELLKEKQGNMLKPDKSFKKKKNMLSKGKFF